MITHEWIELLTATRGIPEGFLGALLAVMSAPFLAKTPLARQLIEAKIWKRVGLIALYLACGPLLGYILGQAFPSLPTTALYLAGFQFIFLAKITRIFGSDDFETGGTAGTGA